MPFIIMRRTDIPDGSLQYVDLKPNTSQRSLIYDGPGRTGYVHNIPDVLIEDLVAAGPPLASTAELQGVAAYLIGHIDTTAVGGSAVFTGAEADAAAGGLVAAAQAGTVLDLAAVDAVLAGVVAGTSLTGGGSTGVLTELLEVMAGSQWIIPAGTDLSDGGGLFAGTVGAFGVRVRNTIDTGSFQLSIAKGNLAGMLDANFTYLDTQGAAVTVYADDGTLLP